MNMAEKWKAAEAISRTVGVSPLWEVVLEKPDGNLHRAFMPTATLEWRAAEYGIDPTDVDTLLEVVLHEPHMPVTDQEDGSQRFTDGSPALWETDTTDAAREAHLGRVKTCPVQITVRGVAALDAIRAGYQPDLERIRAMREAVDTTRWMKKYGGLPQQPLPQTPVEKVEAARA